jgi:hypothetical protein
MLSPSAASDSLFGNINAAQPLQPCDAFTELADTALAKDAFSLGGYAFDPVSGTSASATEGWIGTITAGEDVTNLLGTTNTEDVVTSTHTAASGASASGLPATGTV